MLVPLQMNASRKTLLVLAVAAAAWLNAAARAADSVVQDGGFETSPPERWVFRFGGEGGGSGGATCAVPANGAHGGKFAARLDAEPSAQAGSRAWASVSQQLENVPEAKITVSAWLCGQYADGATNAFAQLRAEYFEDDKCEIPLTSHIRMTSDLSLANLPAGQWTKIELADSMPAGARRVRISIVVQAIGPGGGRQSVWVDDVALTVAHTAPPHKN